MVDLIELRTLLTFDSGGRNSLIELEEFCLIVM